MATLLWLVATDVQCQNTDQPILVIYPIATHPYNTIFASVLSGIKEQVGTNHFRKRSIDNSTSLTELRRWVSSQKPTAVITLGRIAYQKYRLLGTNHIHLLGALDAGPDTHPNEAGVSLSADPALLLTILKQLSPRTERVLVVYHPNRDEWLMDLAKMSGRKHNITIVPYPAENLHESSQHFANIFKYANPHRDALWLTMDTQLVNKNILPTIIEQSWSRSMVVFSNNLNHVNQGVLFSLYPDLEALGQRLGKMATDMVTKAAHNKEIEPLRDVKNALNLRVADHLGLQISEPSRKAFDLVFGTR